MDQCKPNETEEFVKRTSLDVTEYHDLAEERLRNLSTNPVFRRSLTSSKRVLPGERPSTAQNKASQAPAASLGRNFRRDTLPPLPTPQNNSARLCRTVTSEPAPRQKVGYVARPLAKSTNITSSRNNDSRNPMEEKQSEIGRPQKSRVQSTTGVQSNVRGTKEKAGAKVPEVTKASPAELFKDDSPPKSDFAEVTVHKIIDQHLYASYFDLHKKSTTHLHDAEKTPGTSSMSRTKLSVTPRRRRSHKKKSGSTSHSHSATDARSSRRTRSKSSKLRHRRKIRESFLHTSAHQPTTVGEYEAADDRVIELTSLVAPISIDTMRKVTRNGEQTNLLQVFRIYGSGPVEEATQILPRRSAARLVRGGVATVKYSKNMVEITIINADIQASRRGQSNKWTFVHDKAYKTLPIVFGKTVLVKTHRPAPFCLSIGAPYYVSIQQEQRVSADGGERFRESIELRSCKNSGMPCYEMKAIDDTPHSVFNEHVFLGKGIVRIDSISCLPTELPKKLSLFDSQQVSLTRQYRIELPWRQREGAIAREIPRSAQIRDIKPIRRPVHHEKSDQHASSIPNDGTSTKSARSSHERRRAPPLCDDVLGFNLIRPRDKEKYLERRRYAAKVDSNTGSSPPSHMRSSDGESTFGIKSKKRSDLPAMHGSIFQTQPRDYKEDITSAKRSPEQRSSDEAIPKHKNSELRKSGHSSKKPHGLEIKKKKEPPTLKRYDPKAAQCSSDDKKKKSSEGLSMDSESTENASSSSAQATSTSTVKATSTSAQATSTSTVKDSKTAEEKAPKIPERTTKSSVLPTKYSSSPDVSEFSPRAARDEVTATVEIQVMKTPPGVRQKYSRRVRKNISHKFRPSSRKGKRIHSVKSRKRSKEVHNEKDLVSPDIRSDVRQLPPNHSPLKEMINSGAILPGHNVGSVVKEKLTDGPSNVHAH